jgi:hypothetical protein
MKRRDSSGQALIAAVREQTGGTPKKLKDQSSNIERSTKIKRVLHPHPLPRRGEQILCLELHLNFEL